MTLTVFILAGGESLRMSKDKGLMFGGVNRLRGLLEACGFQRIVILCGSEDGRLCFMVRSGLTPQRLRECITSSSGSTVKSVPRVYFSHVTRF